tara:strand:+ start:993 stop:2315 length:1323 start_codon:yes stop_codon:yes gene_type:complete
MSYQKNLFQIVSKKPEGSGNMQTGAAPELHHIGPDYSKGLITTHLDKETFVNVKDQFPWSNSPQRAIDEAPYIDLVEMDITANPMLNQIATNLAVGGNLIPEAYKNTIKQKMTAVVEHEDGSSAQMATGGATDNFMNALDTVVNNNSASSVAPGDTLFPYDNMYTTKPTGFRYIMPYFTQNWKTLSNAFGSDAGETGSGLGSGVIGMGKQVSEIVSNIGKAGGLNFLSPGQYVEQSKFYGFPGREKTYTFGFPIANTRPYAGMTAEETISRNWQLLYLLVYQNTPNRLTRDLILPPCIYEAHVPGCWYAKYAYISSLTIDFLGTRRNMTISIPEYTDHESRDNIRIPSIIPDVYQVTISVTELVGESQNMLHHMMKGKHVMMSANDSSVDSEGFADHGFNGTDAGGHMRDMIPFIGKHNPGEDVRSTDVGRSSGRQGINI